MANTHCKICMFSKQADSTQPCEFNIVDIIKDIKELSVVDNYFYIKNYRCNYGFSENVYLSNPELQKINDLKSFILEKTKIIYYLIVDIREFSAEEIKEKINNIKNLEIKPKLISIISSSQNQNTKDIIEIISSSFSNQKIDWKIHSFINSMSFNDCINISAETTIQGIENLQFIVFDCKKQAETLNSIINHLHYCWVLCQNSYYCFVDKKDSLHLLSLHVALYKAIVSVNKNILDTLYNIPNIDIGEYDFEKSK